VRPLAGPVRVTPYLWNRHQADAEPGVMLQGRGGRVFFPGEELRSLADVLHDVADLQGVDR